MSADFTFQENIDSFIGDKADKEYWLKISSKDAISNSPFDFNVKFNMDIRQSNRDSSGNIVPAGYRKEAVIYSKYQDIKRLEVTDVIIPRFIPTTNIGLYFDGVILNRDPNTEATYYITCYPGIMQKLGTYTPSGGSSMNYIKLTNPKDTIVLTDVLSSDTLVNDTSTFRFKDVKVIDHIAINNIPYPILSVTNNKIVLDNFHTDLPIQTKMISANYFSNQLITLSGDLVQSTSKTLLLTNLPISLFENIYASNIIRLQRTNSSGVKNYYISVSSFSVKDDVNVQFNGTFLNSDTPSSFLHTDTINIILFGFGTRDLLDDRIFYMELDPFIPVKSSATNNQLDKMFGVLFPSTQSKEWLYLSGEPKESFLPRDLRKLDKITIRIFDSDGTPLNDLFKNRQGLLNPNYFKNMYTTVVIKVDEINRSLIIKK
jgi:hypothetical protein